MKKYNLSKIMKRAWELVKKAGMTISSGLKKAWEEAKNLKFEQSAKVAKIHNGVANQYIGTEYDCESNYLTFSLWEKNGKKRIYVNDYKRRAVGFIDCLAGNAISTSYGCNSEERETMQWFISHYEL